MRNWVFFIIIVLLGILQMTLLDYFKVFAVKPDLLLISVCFVSLVFEFKWAFILSVFAGLCKDIFATPAFGLNTLMFALWSFLIARLNKGVTIDYNFIRMALVFIICLLHNTIIGLVLIYLGNLIPLGIFLRIVIFQSIYTALVLPLIFKVGEPIFLKDG